MKQEEFDALLFEYDKKRAIAKHHEQPATIIDPWTPESSDLTPTIRQQYKMAILTGVCALGRGSFTEMLTMGGPIGDVADAMIAEDKEHEKENK